MIEQLFEDWCVDVVRKLMDAKAFMEATIHEIPGEKRKATQDEVDVHVGFVFRSKLQERKKIEERFIKRGGEVVWQSFLCKSGSRKNTR